MMTNPTATKAINEYILPMRNITEAFHYTEFDSLEELASGDRQLLERAREAMKNAYNPFSHFGVGAAVRVDGGHIVTGSNQENRAFPSGLCAERVAIFSAGANHPGETLEAIAITAHSDNFRTDDPVPPCGACRQSLLEYELKQGKPIRVILGADSDKVIVIESVQSLLPMAFREERIGKKL
jgi:cytidine deaminase